MATVQLKRGMPFEEATMDNILKVVARAEVLSSIAIRNGLVSEEEYDCLCLEAYDALDAEWRKIKSDLESQFMTASATKAHSPALLHRPSLFARFVPRLSNAFRFGKGRRKTISHTTQEEL